MVIIFVVEAFTYNHFENLRFGFIRIGSGFNLGDHSEIIPVIIPRLSRNDLGILNPKS